MPFVRLWQTKDEMVTFSSMLDTLKSKGIWKAFKAFNGTEADCINASSMKHNILHYLFSVHKGLHWNCLNHHD